MPIPNKGESKKDFIKRCAPILIKEGKDKDQAVAQCGSLFDNKEFIKEYKELEGEEQTVFDLKDVEIFEAGVWNGDKYTEKDIDNIVASFKEIGNKIKPYLKLGHDKDQKLVQKDGMPAPGWITNLKRVGGKLLADISSMPKRIYELVQNHAYGRWSAEIYWNLKENGKKFPRVLKAVALLGADTPAVTSLDDFIDLYGEVKIAKVYENKEADIKLCTEFTQEVNTMTPEEIKAMQEENAKLKTDNKGLTDKSEASEKKFTDLESKSSKKDEQISELTKSSKQEKVDAYLETKVTDGNISLAQKHLYVSIAMSEEIKANDNGVKVYSYTDGEEKKQIEFSETFDLVQKVIESKSDIDTEKEKSKDSKINKKTYKKDEEKANDGDERHDKIEAHIEEQKKAGKEVSYTDAFNYIASQEINEGGAE